MVWTNAPQSDLYSGKSGGAGATDPQGYAEHDSTWFMYAGLNQQITRHADDPLRGMSVSLSGSLSDQRSNYIHPPSPPPCATAVCLTPVRRTGSASA